jgi:hypothetical protein
MQAKGRVRVNFFAWMCIDSHLCVLLLELKYF